MECDHRSTEMVVDIINSVSGFDLSALLVLQQLFKTYCTFSVFIEVSYNKNELIFLCQEI